MLEHVTSPMYHPCSNGLAENSVRTCKKMIKSILHNKQTKQISEQLADYLFEFRNTVHCTTGFTPARLVFGRELRSKLDLILPPPQSNNSDEENDQQNHHKRTFNVGDKVWARWFVNRKPIWVKGSVTQVLGSRMYLIFFPDYNESDKRHVDQLIRYDGQILTEPENVAAQSTSASNYSPNPITFHDQTTADVSEPAICSREEGRAEEQQTDQLRVSFPSAVTEVISPDRPVTSSQSAVPAVETDNAVASPSNTEPPLVLPYKSRLTSFLYN